MARASVHVLDGGVYRQLPECLRLPHPDGGYAVGSAEEHREPQFILPALQDANLLV